jgi:Large polyvalent protein associated domain 29
VSRAFSSPKGSVPCLERGPGGRLSAAETAVLVRKALRTAHTGVKFRVRSSSYAGGASIDVSWTDGPTTPQVALHLRHDRQAGIEAQTDAAGPCELVAFDSAGPASRRSCRARTRVPKTSDTLRQALEPRTPTILRQTFGSVSERASYSRTMQDRHTQIQQR